MNTSSGMPMARRITGENRTPRIVNRTEKNRPMATAVWTVREVLSASSAPIFRAITMPAPMEKPVKVPMAKKTMEPVLVTAARALRPTRLPTISASAVLYSC